MRLRPLALWALAMVLFVLGWLAPPLLLAQDPTVSSPGTVLLSWGGTIAAALGVALTALLKKLAATVDGTTATWDGTLVKILKPVQPIVAAALGVGLAWLRTKLPGTELPTADAVLAVPAGTVIAIVLRELLSRAYHLVKAF